MTDATLGTHGIRFAPVAEADVPEISELGPSPELHVPLWQYHAGLPLEVCARAGDPVSRGAVLARALDGRGVHVHAPVTGVFLGLREVRMAGLGRRASQALILQPDSVRPQGAAGDVPGAGQAGVCPLLRAGGIRGLGGACYPTHLKLGASSARQTLVINLMETDPEVLCDRALLKSLGWRRALDVIGEAAGFLSADRAIVAVPDGGVMGLAAESGAGVEVRQMPRSYALGNSGLLLRQMRGVGSADQASRIAALNFQTVCAVRDLVAEGEPLVSRLVTAVGPAGSAKAVFRAPFGTPLSRIAEALGAGPQSPLRFGGHFSPTELGRADVVGPMTSSVALGAAGRRPRDPRLPCVGCNLCDAHCPAGISPRNLHAAGAVARAAAGGMMDCVLCGTCDWVCPSRIPITRMLAESMEAWRLRADMLEKKGAALDRKRRLEGRRAAESMRYTNAMSRVEEGGIVGRLVAGAVRAAPPPDTGRE